MDLQDKTKTHASVQQYRSQLVRYTGLFDTTTTPYPTPLATHLSDKLHIWRQLKKHSELEWTSGS